MVRRQQLQRFWLGFHRRWLFRDPGRFVHVRIRVRLSACSPSRAPLTAARCIFSPPRLWTEVDALFSEPVTDVFSGGVAFSYFPTSDGYGMVTFSGDGNT